MLRKMPRHRPDVGDVMTFTGSAAALDRKYRIGWRVADGTDGTPNLIDRFPKFDTMANKGQTGGAKTVTPAGSVGVSVNNHTLSQSQMPSHTHTYSRPNGANTNNGGYGLGADAPLQNYGTTGAGSSGAHNHGASGSFSGSSHTNEPQFYTAVPLYFTGVPGTYGA